MTPEEVLLAKEAGALLRKAIDSLPTQQRLVMTLSHREGFTPEEVCNVMQISRNNFTVHLFHARRNLQQRLQRYFRERRKQERATGLECGSSLPLSKREDARRHLTKDFAACDLEGKAAASRRTPKPSATRKEVLDPLRASEYCEGWLRPSEAAEIEAHLASCEKCRKDFEQTRQLIDAIHRLPPSESYSPET